MEKPKKEDFWDEEDPRGPSTREIDDYYRAMKEYSNSKVHVEEETEEKFYCRDCDFEVDSMDDLYDDGGEMICEDCYYS